MSSCIQIWELSWVLSRWDFGAWTIWSSTAARTRQFIHLLASLITENQQNIKPPRAFYWVALSIHHSGVYSLYGQHECGRAGWGADACVLKNHSHRAGNCRVLHFCLKIRLDLMTGVALYPKSRKQNLGKQSSGSWGCGRYHTNSSKDGR